MFGDKLVKVSNQCVISFAAVQESRMKGGRGGGRDITVASPRSTIAQFLLALRACGLFLMRSGRVL